MMYPTLLSTTRRTLILIVLVHRGNPDTTRRTADGTADGERSKARVEKRRGCPAAAPDLCLIKVKGGVRAGAAPAGERGCRTTYLL